MKNTVPTYRLLAALALAGSVTLMGACATPTRDIDASKEGIKRAQKIDVQDFEKASAEMLNSLYTNGVLQRAARKPAVIGINRIVNDTGEYFDTDLLVVRISEQLLNGGQAQVDMAWGAAPRDANSPALLNPAVTLPDFTLTGKILKNTAQAGSMKQGTYTFQLILTDSRTGLSAWIAQRQITKQGEKSAVGL